METAFLRMHINRRCCCMPVFLALHCHKAFSTSLVREKYLLGCKVKHFSRITIAFSTIIFIFPINFAPLGTNRPAPPHSGYFANQHYAPRRKT